MCPQPLCSHTDMLTDAWLLLFRRDLQLPLLTNLLLWLWVQEKKAQSPNACYALGAGRPDGALLSSILPLVFILGQCQAFPHQYSYCGHTLLHSRITSALREQAFAGHSEVKKSMQSCQMSGRKENMVSKASCGSPTEDSSSPPQHCCIWHMFGTEGIDLG